MRIRSCIRLIVIGFALLEGIHEALGGSAADEASTSTALEWLSEGTGPPLVMLGRGTLGAGAFASQAHLEGERWQRS